MYRGFTHADLARKGLTSPNDFKVGDEYEILLKHPPYVPKYYILKKQGIERIREKYKQEKNQYVNKEMVKASPNTSSYQNQKGRKSELSNGYKNDNYSNSKEEKIEINTDNYIKIDVTDTELIEKDNNKYTHDDSEVEIYYSQDEEEIQINNTNVEDDENIQYSDYINTDDEDIGHEDIHYVETEKVLDKSGLTPLENSIYKINKKPQQHKIINFDDDDEDDEYEYETTKSKFKNNDDIGNMNDEKLKEIVGNLEKTAEVLYAKVKKPVPVKRKGPRHKR